MHGKREVAGDGVLDFALDSTTPRPPHGRCEQAVGFMKGHVQRRFGLLSKRTTIAVTKRTTTHPNATRWKINKPIM
jgi:hypothetical protein